jgi:serine/threonine protein kinase
MTFFSQDIKPANWLLSGGFFPVLKLSDFGLGQEMTHPGEAGRFTESTESLMKSQ